MHGRSPTGHVKPAWRLGLICVISEQEATGVFDAAHDIHTITHITRLACTSSFLYSFVSIAFFGYMYANMLEPSLQVKHDCGLSHGFDSQGVLLVLTTYKPWLIRLSGEA